MPVRRTGLVAVLAVCLTIGLLAPAHADDARTRKRHVDASIQKLKSDLAETSRELAAAAVALRRAQAGLPKAQAAVAKASRDLAGARARDTELAARLAVARKEQQKAERELTAVQGRSDQSHDAVGRIAREAYVTGRMGEAAVVLEADSPDDFATRLILVQSALRSQNAMLGRLAEQRADLTNRRATLDAKRQQVAGLKAAAAANVLRKQAAERSARTAQRRVQALVAAAVAAKAAVEREKAAEDRRYAEMTAESRQLQDLLARLAAAAEQPAASRGRGGGGGGGGSYSGGNGTLGRPINGPITSPYGMRVHPVTGIYKLHDGTDFGAGCGTPIHAAEAGVVVWASNLAGYGNQLAIDHGMVRGVRLATSYSHQSHFAVGVGSQVSRGQVIGYVGATGYATGCHLHLMVYVNGTPVNPMGWL